MSNNLTISIDYLKNILGISEKKLDQVRFLFSERQEFDIKDIFHEYCGVYSLNLDFLKDKSLVLSNCLNIRFGFMEFLASNPKTPEFVLDILSKYDENSVRAKVAGNVSTPIYILDRLSLCGNNYVYEWLADNENLTDEIYKRLFNSRNASVYFILVQNEKVPTEILKGIVNVVDSLEYDENSDNEYFDDHVAKKFDSKTLALEALLERGVTC